MATLEHCLYCFEALAAHLEDRDPLSLADIQKSWASYVTTVLDADADDSEPTSPPGSAKLTKRLPALRRLAASPGSTSTSTTSSSTSSTTSLQPATGADTPATSLSSPTPPPTVTSSPLFVTWNTLSQRHGHILRGCIGTFEAQDLTTGLASYALTAALHDTRFRPVSARELPTLQVAVTLLTDFEDADGPMDWELGTHGLRISFTHGGRRYGATYLPDVAAEQGWTKEETLVSLMRKAGWTGPKERWTDVALKVTRYQGKKEGLEYAEYKRWREWAGKE
ncbi:AMMECR1 domain-containing protein [Schizothecium vesticola]|uniref:AMMECR1 domain-containing protein n=1 Tax=Schizothecium vesticola TaxID=314040 RepID=A0AA40F2G7_9PEZI|nr:AMMECR1 domain-containing protein [Schizothecium vesticola]